MIKGTIEVLRKLQQMLKEKGEENFSDLGRKHKKEICDDLAEIMDYETDGDTDGCSVSFSPSKKFNITFYSNCEYSYYSEISRSITDMAIMYEYPDGWDDVPEISEAIEILEELLEEEMNVRFKLGLLNTSIITTEGTYTLRDITLEEAQRLVADNADNLDSAIGHQATAEVMTTLLGQEIAVNRQFFQQQAGQCALVFKLNGRLEEGRILSISDLETIGYKFQILERKE